MRGCKRTSLAKRRLGNFYYLYRRKVAIHSSILVQFRTRLYNVTNISDDYKPHNATRGCNEIFHIGFSTSPRIEIALLEIESRAYRVQSSWKGTVDIFTGRQSLAAIGKYGPRYLQRPVFNWSSIPSRHSIENPRSKMLHSRWELGWVRRGYTYIFKNKIGKRRKEEHRVPYKPNNLTYYYMQRCAY